MLLTSAIGWGIYIHLEVNQPSSISDTCQQVRQIYAKRKQRPGFFFVSFSKSESMVETVPSCEVAALKTKQAPRPFSPPSSPAVLFEKIAFPLMPIFDEFA